MPDRWIVLGGWGVEPEALRPLFGEGSAYIDTNRLMPDIVKKGKLLSDWRERCTRAIAPKSQRPCLLAGWSTGAMVALGCAGFLPIETLVLISATPSFCRTPDFRHGMRPGVLRIMREKLSTDPSAVVRDFRKKCGFADETATAIPWTSGDLRCGLYALEQMTPFDLAPLRCAPLFIHGTKDAIIPEAAGRSLYRRLGGRFLSLDAPHACFIDNEASIRSAIDKHLKGILNEPV